MRVTISSPDVAKTLMCEDGYYGKVGVLHIHAAPSVGERYNWTTPEGDGEL
ncbi:MAG: hypothetical protein RMJ54_15085 [Roseiflexaceae bacterium]|nr:hypothetical protein [Roseiflexaceae bacterium]